jgi:DNA modification methylase
MRVHPTQKPIALCEWAFDKYGKPDDVIFDPFLGSAPSIIAAQKMEGDRTVYGFELSPDYCEVIILRYENFTGDVAKLVGSLN